MLPKFPWNSDGVLREVGGLGMGFTGHNQAPPNVKAEGRNSDTYVHKRAA